MAIALVHELTATQIGREDICIWKGSSSSERLIEIIHSKKYNALQKLIVEGTEALLLCLFLLYSKCVVNGRKLHFLSDSKPSSCHPLTYLIDLVVFAVRLNPKSHIVNSMSNVSSLVSLPYTHTPRLIDRTT